MWTLQRFHQSISHAHVPRSFPMNLLCLCSSYFMSVNLVKLEGLRCCQRNSKGERTFALKPKQMFKLVWSRIRVNSLKSKFQLISHCGSFLKVDKSWSRWDEKSSQLLRNVFFGKHFVCLKAEHFQCQDFFAAHNLSTFLICFSRRLKRVCMSDCFIFAVIQWNFDSHVVVSQEGWEQDFSSSALKLNNENKNIVFQWFLQQSNILHKTLLWDAWERFWLLPRLWFFDFPNRRQL